jgi:hypothetical protein
MRLTTTKLKSFDYPFHGWLVAERFSARTACSTRPQWAVLTVEYAGIASPQSGKPLMPPRLATCGYVMMSSRTSGVTAETSVAMDCDHQRCNRLGADSTT